MKMQFQFLALIALIAVLLFPACQPAGQAEAEAEAAQAEAIHQLVNNVVSMWNTLNPDLISDCYASSFLRVTPTGAQSNHEELAGLLSQVGTMYSNFRVDMNEVVVKGDQAFGTYTISGENTGPMGENMPATGGSFNVEGAVVIKVQDGKVVEENAYWNQLQLLTQLGYSLQAPEMEEEEM